MLVFFMKAIFLGYSDYASYYFGSQELLKGNYLNVYDTATLNLLIKEQGFKELFVSYTPFPPFTSLIYSPLIHIHINISKIIFNSISCIVFLITLIRAVRYFSIPSFFLLLVPVIFYTPLRSNIFFGQSYLLLFCVLVEGYIAYDKKQLLLSSFLWAGAILFKIFPVLIVLFLLFNKKYKNILFIMCFCGILFGLSILILGPDCWIFYLTKIFPRLSNGELNDSFTYIFQSGFMLLKKIFIYDELLNPDAVYHNPYLFVFTLALFKAYIIAGCVIVSREIKENKLLIFSICVMASMLISPNGSTYSLILLIVPCIALFHSNCSLVQKVLICLLLVLICNIPIHYLQSFPVWMMFPRLYLMIAFFTFLLILCNIKFNYKILTGFFVLFFLIGSPTLFSETDKSTYFFTKNRYDLIYNYYVRNDSVYCSYWTREGDKEAYIISHADCSSKDLVLENNQIYYRGFKITDSPDWKKKPMLLYGEYIIYLSDKNRGVGFYTLRKISLSNQF